jgi:plastocyanin
MRRSLNLCGWLVAAAAVAYPAAASLGATAAPVATVQAIDDPPSWDPAAVSAAPGDTVRWDFSTAAALPHAVTVTGPGGFRFDGAIKTKADPPDDVVLPYSGSYLYSCPLHPEMTGTLTVSGSVTPTPTGTPTSTATPTVTATATVTPTATATAVPTAVPTTVPTPPPGPADVPPPADVRAPSLRALTVSGKRRAAVIGFRLDEPATVTVSARRKGARRVVRRTRALAAGKGSIRLALAPGRHAVTVGARDAAGNRSATLRRSVRVRR